jgi:hypothetical protein
VGQNTHLFAKQEKSWDTCPTGIALRADGIAEQRPFVEDMFNAAQAESKIGI